MIEIQFMPRFKEVLNSLLRMSNNICYFLCAPCRTEKYVIKSHNDPPADFDLFIILL